MMEEEIFKESTYRRHTDEEAFSSDDDDPFSIIRTKDAPVDHLRRWRRATLVLNASRRFRYTLDLKKEEEKQQALRKIKAHAEASRSAALLKEAQKQANVPENLTAVPSGDFAIGQEQLSSTTRDHNNEALQQFGGVKELSDMLKTDLEKGILGDDADLLKRRNVFGSNTYPQKKGRTFWMFFWEAWQDLTLIILGYAAVASLALGIKTEGIKEGAYDGASIAFAVILVIIVTAVCDYRQSFQFENLKVQKRNIRVEVIRGGRRIEVSIHDLVVGDVVPLNIGDQVPADGLLISGHSLSINESCMTGESEHAILHIQHLEMIYMFSRTPRIRFYCPAAKSQTITAPCFTSTTHFVNGVIRTFLVLVTSVGTNTEWGLLMANTSEDTGEETPLEVRLNGMVTFIGIIGLTIAFIVLAVLLARHFTKNASGSIQLKVGKIKVGDAIDVAIKILAITVAIFAVAVPEGLPPALTSILAYSMRKMVADKALVRRLSACETMGFATTICSDKTGTLTLNEMTVVEAYVGGRKIDPPDSNSHISPKVTSLLIEGIAQNTTGSVYVPPGGGDAEVYGSPTEKAILQWGIKLGMNFDLVRSQSSVIHVLPFNSEKKQGGVAVQLSNSEVHIHWKGAAEIVLSSCTRYIGADDRLVEMDEDKALIFKKAIEDMASGSLRCVAIAYKTYEREKVPADEEELSHWELPEEDLTLVAIVGMKDPCRPSVKDAVRQCQIAGVKVCMVTGDNIQTARAIALECGILTSEADATKPNKIIEGKSFRALSDTERKEIAENILVMGRSTPNDKLLLVQALRKRGHVVVVTGDGADDAPALENSGRCWTGNGYSGNRGRQRELRNNFASIIKFVRWGRSVYANIQKFIQFQHTVNISDLVISFVVAVSSGDVPLNAAQLLWINFIVGTLGPLAFATEPPTDNLMRRSPVGRRDAIITNIMWRNLLIQAVYQLSVLLVLNFWGKSILNLEHVSIANKVKNTVIFNSYVFRQIFNEFNARRPVEINIFQGITKDHLFSKIVAITIILQIIIIEFLGKLTSTTRLNWKHWIISIVIGFISWLLAFLGKFIPVPKTPITNAFKGFKRRYGRLIKRMCRGSS